MKRALLEGLVSGEWLTGRQLSRADRKRIPLSPLIYMHLAELEDHHCVLSRPLKYDKMAELFGEPNRREYQITSIGRAALLRDDL